MFFVPFLGKLRMDENQGTFLHSRPPIFTDQSLFLFKLYFCEALLESSPYFIRIHPIVLLKTVAIQMCNTLIRSYVSF